MIYLEIAGRAGNQLFRYAFARKIQILTGRKLFIDFHRVYEEKGDFWENSLKRFKVTEYEEVKDKKILKKNMSLIQKIIYFWYKSCSFILKKNKEKQKAWQMKKQPLLNRFGFCFLELGYFDYDVEKLKKNKFIYICGSFESPKYFDDIRNELLEEFEPKSHIKEENKMLIEKIRNSESICVSVRRGDFLNLNFYNVCNNQYYSKALNYFKKIYSNPTFVFFSDDIEWCKENLKVDNCECLYETGKDDVAEKLMVMKQCKNFIISNSTFSWWAQYLSVEKNKKIVSPSRWYNSKMESDLIDKENWILM